MAKKQIKKYIFEPGISKDDNLFPNAVALLLANKGFLQAQVVAFINNQIANSVAPFVGYTYASQKCTRDVGYFIDAVAHDLRYGGNVQCRKIADYFWIDGEPQIRGDVSPEIAGQTYLKNIINNFIFTNTEVSPSYSQTAVPQVFLSNNDVPQNGETGASARNTTLWSVFSAVIQNGLSAMPAKEPGVTSIKVIGNYSVDEFLLITDTSTGNILYNFADSSRSITVSLKQGRSSGNGELLSDLDFPYWWQTSDAITTVYFAVDTTSLSASAPIQIFVEESHQTIRPWDFGTDAVERMRVAAPQAMLDADFEYGLQPTKWQALGQIRQYPSLYEIPGTDLSVIAVGTDASVGTGSFGSSLITVTTSGTHGFSAGQPITVKGLNAAISGFARAEGSFLVYNVPSSVSFTYYASARVGTSTNDNLYTSFVQIRQAAFFTGASIGQPTFSVFSNGSEQTVQTRFISTSGSSIIAYTGSAPTPGSPISGSPSIIAGTSISGSVGSNTVSANVKTDVSSVSSTSLTLVDLTGVQQNMALSDASGNGLIISSLDGNTLNLSGPLGRTYVGADGQNTGVSGSNINPIGVGATFKVDRVSGAYSVSDPADSSANGQNYAVGDRIVLLGSDLGGTDGTNDIVISVSAVNSGGSINSFAFTGTAFDGSGTYTSVFMSSTTGSGVGAAITVLREGGTGIYDITLVSGGSGFTSGDSVTWLGSLFGGVDGTNNIVMLVDGVTAGVIIDYRIVPTPLGATGDATYAAVSGTNDSPAGVSAVFTVIRSNGLYSATATTPGTGYKIGNRIKVLGTNLFGSSPYNDAILSVASIGTNGAITSVTASGITYVGDSVSIYPTLTISEALTGSISNNTILNVGAIPTIQVDFSSNHGLLPGTTILSSITSQPAPSFDSVSQTLPSSGSWTGIAWTNGQWVAVRSGSSASAKSSNGTSWTAGGALPSSTTWTSVAAGLIGTSNYFVAIASGGTAAAYSTDFGLTWSASTLPSSSTWSSVTYYGGYFVAIASGGTAAAYSSNGTSWTASTLPSSATWSDVVGGLIGTSNYFVAIASGGTVAAYSPDNGATWAATGALPASTTWSAISFGANRFVAVARGTVNAAVSTNALTWTASTLPTSANWNCIDYSNDGFLVIADGSTSALTSFTGETGTWTDRVLAASATWEEVAAGSFNGTTRFAVVGNNTSALNVDLLSANHQLATGPHVVTQVPSLTSIRYPARTTGVISTNIGLAGVVYVRPDSFFTHRPFDGGVQLGTGGPSHGAQAIRQSKKYIRYQSGKGMMYTTGGLFAPSYNLASATASGTSINSVITFTTDDTDHGLQPGAEIEIIGCVSFEYNGSYIVESVVDARRFRVRSNVVISDLVASLGDDCKVVLKRWHGSTVRIGAFDEQNGLFYQYDGQEMAVVRRSSTNQLTGTAAIGIDSNQVTGTGTRFQDQLSVGDKIVIRGMSHVVTGISSQTSMTVSPDWRGASSIVGARICITTDLYVPQSQWNMDPADGTGPSGYNILPWRMQMLGMQYTWYAAGFVEFMMRGADGKFVFLHRMRNSNVNTEAYMRTANLPVRYEVENASAKNRLSAAITSSSTSIPLSDAGRFPSSGVVYIDNELISYSGKNGNNLIGVSRGANLSNFTAGINRTFTAGIAVSHADNTGVELVSCTTTPTISHWGSALLTDGLFDNDRGYLFNYAATGLSITTTKQTAFMIRLAPSVSNALTGDLGERDLLNRAQLLLAEIAITADTGTGAIVVEGILNPRNYPTNPTFISWSGLSSAASGGQPSFAQIALGGSVNWGGVPATTSTAIVQGALTATVTARAFTTVTNALTAVANPVGLSGYANALSAARSDFVITNSSYNSFSGSTPLRVGDTLSMNTTGTLSGVNIVGSAGQFTCTAATLYVGMTVTVSGAQPGPTGTPPVPSAGTISGYTSPTTYLISATNGSTTFTLVTLASAAITTVPGSPAGRTFTLSNFLTSNQSISSITPSYLGSSYTRIVMSSPANLTSGVGTNIPVVDTNTISTGYNSAFSTGRSDFLVTDADAAVLSAAVGDQLSVNPFIVASQTVVSITTAYALISGVSYTRFVMSSIANSTSTSGSTVTVTVQASTTNSAYANTNYLFFTLASWNASGATVGTRIATSYTQFPAGTSVAAVTTRRLGSTSVIRASMTQTSNASISSGATTTFQFGDPQYALPGEQVFSFITNPGSTSNLDLSQLKELTTTAIGGRGAFPNGPDVLAVNVYKVSGTATPAAIILRWGEAQA